MADESKAPVAGKHWFWLGSIALAAAAWVLVEVFAEGRHVEAIIGLIVGLVVPGSPLGGIARRGEGGE